MKWLMAAHRRRLQRGSNTQPVEERGHAGDSMARPRGAGLRRHTRRRRHTRQRRRTPNVDYCGNP